MTTVVCVLYICPLSSRAHDCPHLSDECRHQLKEEFGEERFYWVSCQCHGCYHCHMSTLCQHYPIPTTTDLSLNDHFVTGVVNTTG